MRFIKAEGIIRSFMSAMGFKYMAIPHDKIYYMFKRPVGRMYRHELKHLEQYRRDGVIKYFLTWWWEYFTKGYENIGYEIEARKAETELI